MDSKLEIKLDYALPEYPEFVEGIRRAPLVVRRCCRRRTSNWLSAMPCGIFIRIIMRKWRGNLPKSLKRMDASMAIASGPRARLLRGPLMNTSQIALRARPFV